MNNGSNYKEYWENNIREWGNLYLQLSHHNEELKGPTFFRRIYQFFIIPYESKLMKIRYQKTIEFIEQNVKDGNVVSDIGCGTGIFTVQCLKKNAGLVNAIDISINSLKTTEENVNAHCFNKPIKVEYYQKDMQAVINMPKSDISIAVGVLPYIENLDIFFKNVLTETDQLFFQFSDLYHPANYLRKYLKFLNVRNLQFQTKHDCERICEKYGFRITRFERFATGYLGVAKRKQFNLEQ